MYDLWSNPHFRCDVFFDGLVHRGLDYPYDQTLFPELAPEDLLSRPLEKYNWDVRITHKNKTSDGAILTIIGGEGVAHGAMGALACFRSDDLSWSIATDSANPIKVISTDDAATVFAETTSGHHWQISGHTPAKLLYLPTRSFSDGTHATN